MVELYKLKFLKSLLKILPFTVNSAGTFFFPFTELLADNHMHSTQHKKHSLFKINDMGCEWWLAGVNLNMKSFAFRPLSVLTRSTRLAHGRKNQCQGEMHHAARIHWSYYLFSEHSYHLLHAPVVYMSALFSHISSFSAVGSHKDIWWRSITHFHFAWVWKWNGSGFCAFSKGIVLG